jgi:hypothetical protein
MSITSNLSEFASDFNSANDGIIIKTSSGIVSVPDNYYSTSSNLSANLSIIQGVNDSQNNIIGSAFSKANSAFDNSNTKFSSSGGTVTGDVTITGNVVVSGTTTTINVDTVTVKDKNIVLANVASPTDVTADGAGLTIKGTTDKTWNWVDSNDSWTSSENLNLLSGKTYKINGTDVLTGSALGSGVTSSSLTSVGTLSSLSVSGTTTLSGGTVNGVPYLNGSKVLTTGTALTFDGTNLGIGVNSSGQGKFQILASLGTTNDSAIRITDNATTSMFFNNTASGVSSIWSSGALAFGVASSNPFTEQMRLTSTGLGIGLGGGSPATKLDVQISGGRFQVYPAVTATGVRLLSVNTGNSATVPMEISGTDIRFTNSSNVLNAILDSSGNLGLGVTPSAWGGAGLPAFQRGSSSFFEYGYNNTVVGSNFYFDGTLNRYFSTGAASYYQQVFGAHNWYTAASGTINTNIGSAFATPKMTLDASGNLGIGLNNPSGYGRLAVYGSVSAYASSNNNPDASYILDLREVGASTGDDRRLNICLLNGSSASNRIVHYRHLFSSASFLANSFAFNVASSDRLVINAPGTGGVGDNRVTINAFDGANNYAIWASGYCSFNADSRVLGNFFVQGSLSKGSGSFKIDHPLPDLSKTHYLVHSFIEGPQADNIYRGKVVLVNGRAEVDIDKSARMTDGTFVALNRNVQCFTSNESDWDAVRGSVDGNILTVECQNALSTATISWMVIGERKDKHMYDTNWTDEYGRVIVEPIKNKVVFGDFN